VRAVNLFDHGDRFSPPIARYPGLQYRDVLEIVGRDRLFRVLRADPTLAGQKAGHTLALGDVLGVVPVVELVLGDV